MRGRGRGANDPPTPPRIFEPVRRVRPGPRPAHPGPRLSARLAFEAEVGADAPPTPRSTRPPGPVSLSPSGV
ncbi:hypothetical protein FNV62_34245 [Streptomyces sp. RLB3-17]|nr:hypothetical protein FNV62_34245 [Streptomyces sp. RLB3-17]